MLFAISSFIAKFFGLDISKVQRFVIVAAIILGLLFILFCGLWLRSCFTKQAKIDIKTVDKINSKNRREREAALQQVIEENADVVATVDNRTTIAETNTIERNREIAEKIKAADQEIQKAKEQGRDVTGAELECILIPSNCQ